MLLLTREQVVAAQDFTTEDVEVKEWGGVMRVRGLSGSERSKLERMFGLGKDKDAKPPTAANAKDTGKLADPTWDNWRHWLVAVAAVDENMKPVFAPSDVEQLGKRSAEPLDRVANVVLRISGVSREERAEMGKDSEGTPTDETSSD